MFMLIILYLYIYFAQPREIQVDHSRLFNCSNFSTSVNYNTKYKTYKLVKLDSARSKKITN